MFRNNDDHFDDGHGLLLGADIHPTGKNQRHEPKLGGFGEDDDHDYEEPDRDTDHAAGYHVDGDLEEEEEEEEEERDDASEDEDEDEEPHDLFPEETVANERFEPIRFTADEPDDWLEREGNIEEEQEEEQRWPLGLIVVGVVALVLLIAGGYGVMQQRAATEAELAELRATLATSASPEEVRTSLGALRELKESYDKLKADADALTLENRRLTDTVAGLQSQLGVQQSVMTKTAAADQATTSAQAVAATPAPTSVAPGSATASEKPAAAKPVTALTAAQPPAAQPPTTKPAAQQAPSANSQAAAATTSGPWFVNFGSYASRAVAEEWAARLRPNAGKVIIAPVPKDGKTLYRLRVIGLGSKGTADAVAQKLQSDLQVAQLWVGKE